MQLSVLLASSSNSTMMSDDELVKDHGENQREKHSCHVFKHPSLDRFPYVLRLVYQETGMDAASKQKQKTVVKSENQMIV